MKIPNVATDFLYDTERLSYFGCILCRFGEPNLDTTSIGNNLTFNTVRPVGSDRHLILNGTYEDTLTTTFQICKHEDSKSKYFSSIEVDGIIRWLSRKDGYHKFKIFQQGYEDIFFIGGFNNFSTIKIGGLICGIEFTFVSDSPYAYLDTMSYDFSIDKDTGFSITDLSSETGHIYPSTFTCKCLESGNLVLSNTIEERTVVINNCLKDEIITLDGIHKVIESSVPTHLLYNDFNYNFFRLANTYNEKTNIITSSIPCQIHLEYNAIRKVGLG